MVELPRGIIKHTQLLRHDPDNGIYGDCWRATVASLLRLPIEEVPHVCDGPDDGKASDRMRAFLYTRNCALIQIPFNGDMSLEQVLEYVGSLPVSGGLHWCLMGTSRTGCNHVVICKGNEIVHDPSITQSGIVGPANDGLWWAEWIVQRPACDATTPAPSQQKHADDCQWNKTRLTIQRRCTCGARDAEQPAPQDQTMPRLTFPILNGNGARIDYQLVADHGGQAQKNHYQSVERLAQRGGLSWCELHAVLHDRAYQKMDQNTAIIECRSLEARYLAALAPPPPQSNSEGKL